MGNLFSCAGPSQRGYASGSLVAQRHPTVNTHTAAIALHAPPGQPHRTSSTNTLTVSACSAALNQSVAVSKL